MAYIQFDGLAGALIVPTTTTPRAPKNLDPTANNAPKSYDTGASRTGGASGVITQAVKGDSSIDWNAISGAVGTVALSTRAILDQQAARKAERRASRNATLPGPANLPNAGGISSDLPWAKILGGAAVGILGIFLLSKLLNR